MTPNPSTNETFATATSDQQGDTTIVQLVYASTATRPLSDAELVELLDQARANNTAQDITGMLLYHDGSFIQAMEGPPSAVLDLYAKITRDPRHHDERLIYTLEQDHRSFGDWSMGFHHLDRDELDGKLPEGFDRFLETGLVSLADHADDTVRDVLLLFRDGAFRAN